MSRINEETADYLASQISGLTRFDEDTQLGNVHAEVRDDDSGDMQVVVRYGDPGGTPDIPDARSQTLKVQVHGTEDAAHDMAWDIYNFLKPVTGFATDSFTITSLRVDQPTRALDLADLVIYQMDLNVQYYVG